MQYKELSGTGTFVLKSAPGYLQALQVNLSVATTTVQIFDNITNSAPAIAGGVAFALPAVGNTPTYNYDCHFSTGLTIVIGGSGTFSITVSYY